MPAKYTRGLSLADRFWAKVEYDKAGCWLWTASLSEDGYGYFGVHEVDGWRMRKAHRIAYQLAYGPIPEGVRVLHTCDDPRCVNPEHLFLGTQTDNMRDMAAKGRGVYRARLTAEQVRTIRARYAAGGVTQRELGAEYGLTPMGIGHIIRHQTWRNPP
jgi:hypothetical protein